MGAFADDQASIVGSVGEQVDEALETAESWLQWVLVLMWPGRVGRKVFTARQCEHCPFRNLVSGLTLEIRN